MRHLSVIQTSLITIFAFFLIAADAPTAIDRELPVLTVEDSRELVRTSVKLIRENYVVPQEGERIAAAIERRLDRGHYDETDVRTFVMLFHQDLRRISDDLHMSFHFDPELSDVYLKGAGPENEPGEEKRLFYENLSRVENGGIKNVEWLDGNIGYLQLTGFWGGALAAEKVSAAMQSLHGAKALILDLRYNTGGRISAGLFLQSYFFAQPTHIMSTFNRPSGSTKKHFTGAPDAAINFVDVPLYILTSNRTASMAENFSLGMKVEQKGTLIGEKTAGAGHSFRYFPVGKGFMVGISVGQTVTARTGQGWQGSGVTPDIETTAEAALEVAYRTALETLKSRSTDPLERARYNWALITLDTKDANVRVDRRILRKLEGRYGPWTISHRGGSLYLDHQGWETVRLEPLTEILYQHTKDPNIRFFFVIEKGKAVALIGHKSNGFADRFERSVEDRRDTRRTGLR